jgi:hypothetical protein
VNGRKAAVSMAKCFHPSSTLDGRDKIELFKRALISVLSRLVIKSTDPFSCSWVDRKLVSP